MRLLFTTLLINITFLCTAQKLDFSLSAGTGKTYLFESLDKGVNVNYAMPMSLMAEIRYTPKAKTWGIKLRLLQLQSGITGTNWENNTILYGYINSLTTSVLLENEIKRKKMSYGFNFGLGITKEIIQPLQYLEFTTAKPYASISGGMHLSYKLTNNFDVQLLPQFLLTDPFKATTVIFRSRRANLAGEDLSLLINVGLRYKLLN